MTHYARMTPEQARVVFSRCSVNPATPYADLTLPQLDALLRLAPPRWTWPSSPGAKDGAAPIEQWHRYLLRRLRSTKREHVLQGHYGAHGWEDLCAEDTRREALRRLKEYRDNEGGNYRIVTRRSPRVVL